MELRPQSIASALSSDFFDSTCGYKTIFEQKSTTNPLSRWREETQSRKAIFPSRAKWIYNQFDVRESDHDIDLRPKFVDVLTLNQFI